jgi:GntR family transcriptional regulator
MIPTPKPRYEQIADLLRDRIADGTYRPGSALPGEPALAAELGVSRVTVNRALGLLRAMGRVQVHRGAGTFVRSLPTIVRDASRRYGRRAYGSGTAAVELSELSLRARTEYPEVGRVTAPTRVAGALQLPPGTEVLVRRRVLYANDEPTQLADSYYPWQVTAAEALLRPETSVGGSYERLAELGCPVLRFTEYVTGRMPTDSERDRLRLAGGQPVFDVLHIAWTIGDQPIEAACHVLPCHLWTLRYDWDDAPPPEPATAELAAAWAPTPQPPAAPARKARPSLKVSRQPTVAPEHPTAPTPVSVAAPAPVAALVPPAGSVPVAVAGPAAAGPVAAGPVAVPDGGMGVVR